MTTALLLPTTLPTLTGNLNLETLHTDDTSCHDTLNRTLLATCLNWLGPHFE